MALQPDRPRGFVECFPALNIRPQVLEISLLRLGELLSEAAMYRSLGDLADNSPDSFPRACLFECQSYVAPRFIQGRQQSLLWVLGLRREELPATVGAYFSLEFDADILLFEAADVTSITRQICVT
jgi:hypothetical protein